MENELSEAQGTQARSVPAISDCITVSLAGQRISVEDPAAPAAVVLPPGVVGLAALPETELGEALPDDVVEPVLVLAVVPAPVAGLVVELVVVVPGVVLVGVLVPEAAEPVPAAPAV